VPVLGARRGPGESSSSYPSETGPPPSGSSPQRGVADASNSAVPGVHVSASCTCCSSGGGVPEELGFQGLSSGAVPSVPAPSGGSGTSALAAMLGYSPPGHSSPGVSRTERSSPGTRVDG